MTDQEIVAQLKRRTRKDDNEALAKLYHNNYKMVEVLIRENSGTHDDALDIFQDSMIVLYNKVKEEEFVLESKLSTYLYSIARNLWLKKLRKNKREVNIEFSNFENLVDEQDIVNQLVFTEEQKMIGNLLSEVGKRCAKILKLFYFEKSKMVDIAKELQLGSEQSAKNQKSKCIKKLKEIVSSKNIDRTNLT